MCPALHLLQDKSSTLLHPNPSSSNQGAALWPRRTPAVLVFATLLARLALLDPFLGQALLALSGLLGKMPLPCAFTCSHAL